MLRESIGWDAIVSKLESKPNKKSEPAQFLTLKHESIGELQTFLNSYQLNCDGVENVAELFRYPVKWKSMSLNASTEFSIEIENLNFRGKLREIKLSTVYKNGLDVFTYQLVFETALEPEQLKDLGSMVNYKVVNDKGNKVLMNFRIFLTDPESLAESVESDNDVN